MFDFNTDLSAQADSAYSAKDVRKGRYAFRVDDITETKSQVGAQKYEVKCVIVSQADKQADLIGVARKQHFVVGHAKANVAQGYKNQFLALLRACGVDLSKIKDEGALYMAIKGVIAAKPVLIFDVEPQAKDPKYLDWVLVVKGDTTPVSPVVAPAPVVAPVASPAPTVVIPADDDLFG